MPSSTHRKAGVLTFVSQAAAETASCEWPTPVRACVKTSAIWSCSDSTDQIAVAISRAWGVGLSAVAAIVKLHGFRFNILPGPGFVAEIVIGATSISGAAGATRGTSIG